MKMNIHVRHVAFFLELSITQYSVGMDLLLGRITHHVSVSEDGARLVPVPSFLIGKTMML